MYFFVCLIHDDSVLFDSWEKQLSTHINLCSIHHKRRCHDHWRWVQLHQIESTCWIHVQCRKKGLNNSLPCLLLIMFECTCTYACIRQQHSAQSCNNIIQLPRSQKKTKQKNPKSLWSPMVVTGGIRGKISQWLAVISSRTNSPGKNRYHNVTSTRD
jgi:hypothetical protein